MMLDGWERKVYEFAERKHRAQTDDEGKSYFEAHILQVVEIVKIVTDDRDIIMAAYLHDTIEDTATHYEELVRKFNRRVADLVMELTHEGEKDVHGRYFPRLKSKDAVIIKLADRTSNLSRMNGWDEERQLHYVRKSIFSKRSKHDWIFDEDKDIIACKNCGKTPQEINEAT